MASGLNLPNLQIRPDVVSSGAPPSGAQLLLSLLQQGIETGLRKTEERGKNSRSSMEHEARMAEYKLASDKEKTRVAELKHLTEVQSAAATAADPLIQQMLAGGRLDEALQLANQVSGGKLNIAALQQNQRPPSAIGGQGLVVSGGQQQGGVAPFQMPAGLSENGQQFVKAWSMLSNEGKGYFAEHILPKLAQLDDNARRGAAEGNLEKITGVSGTGELAGKTVTRYVDRKTGKTVQQWEEAPSKDRWVMTNKVAESGRAIMVNQATGEEKESMGEAGLGLLAPLALTNITRANQAIQTMDQVHRKWMVPFENEIIAGTAKYDGWEKFLQQYAKAQSADGVLNRAAVALAVTELNKTNPKLAKYLWASELWAFEDSQLQNRPSDFRTKMDHNVSSIGAGLAGNADFVTSVQESRATRLNGYNEALPQFQALLKRGLKRLPATGIGTPQTSPSPGTTVVPEPFKP